VTRMELLAYLSANLFRIYTLFRFTENFFSERKTTVKWIIVSFLIYFSINSVCFLCFPMIGVNILSNLNPFFCVTLFYRSKTSVRVLITVIVYSISIFADIALFSVQHLLHLNSVVVSSGVATSLLIFLIERLYEYFFPREKLEKKAEIHIEELLLIIFIPLGSIIIALRGMNHAFEDYLPESIILFAINGIVFYMYDALKKNEKQKIEKMQLQQQNLLYENQIQLQRESEEKMRMLRHDMKNHFYRMKTMVHQGEIPLLEEYMEHIISETESIVPICRTGNSDVDGIVNVKLTKAQREGTEIHLDLKIPTKLNIDSFDMNCILGNLFDNALEALSKVDKKILYFRMVYEKGVVNICLRNMFDGQLRVNEKNQLLSLKQDRKECHGLGIKNVVETVKKYDGKFEYEQEKNVFSVYAMMYER